MFRRSIFIKITAVGLMACLACVNPLRTLSPANGSVDVLTGLPTESKAADSDGAYVKEVRLAIDKEPENAKQILEDDGYEVIDQDLNEEAGSYWTKMGDQAVYMGIKRTNNQAQAIRDMKTMNMHGKYSFGLLEQKLEQHKDEAKKIYDKFKVALAEFRNNYNAGDLGAKISYENLQLIREDDSGMQMGDLLLSDVSEEDLLKVMLEGNTYIRAFIIKTLTVGVEEERETGRLWTDRVSKATSYKDVLKQYSRELYGKDATTAEETERVKRVASDELDDAAKTILAHWDEIRETITDVKDAEEIVLDFEEGTEEDESTELLFETCNTAAAECLKTVKYGKKTLYHLFMVSKETFENDITKLYPLVYALSPGQRSILDLIDPVDLIQGAVMRIGDDMAGKASTELKKEVENIVGDVEEMSVYSGVDRSMYREGAALTSEATQEMYFGAEEYNSWEDFNYFMFVISVSCAACFCIGGVWFLYAALNQQVQYDIQRRVVVEFIDVVDDVTDTVKDKFVEITEEFTYTEEQSKFGEVIDNYVAYGYIMLAASVVFAAFAVYEYIQASKNEHNVKYLPIPETIVDFDTENDAGKYLTYNVVKWNLRRDEPNGKNIGRADRADLNGDGGKQWLALYTSKDKVLGDPILADSITAKTGKDGGKTAPGNDFVPLTMFGNASIQNLVDETYSYNDEVDGIWMWYLKATEDAEVSKLVDDTEEDAEVIEETEEDATEDTASGAAAETTGSNISGGRIAVIGGCCAVGVFLLGIGLIYYKRKKTPPMPDEDDKD